MYILCIYTYAWPRFTLLGMTLHICGSPSTDIGSQATYTVEPVHTVYIHICLG